MNIVELADGKGAACRDVLESLPNWFGIPEAIDDYVRAVEQLPVLAAVDGGRVLGLVSVQRHFDTAGEIHVMGVRPDAHRRGIGRALVDRVGRLLGDEGRAYLTVKTLSASRPDQYYDRTRAFYLAVGFRPLEELPTLWHPSNPCLILIKDLRERDNAKTI